MNYENFKIAIEINRDLKKIDKALDQGVGRISFGYYNTDSFFLFRAESENIIETRLCLAIMDTLLKCRKSLTTQLKILGVKND